MGGDKPDFDVCALLFGSMGKNIVYLRGCGTGQHAKMANQTAIASALSGVCEALADAEARAEGVTLPVLEQALAECRTLEADGFSSLGTQGLIKYYEK